MAFFVGSIPIIYNKDTMQGKHASIVRWSERTVGAYTAQVEKAFSFLGECVAPPPPKTTQKCIRKVHTKKVWRVSKQVTPITQENIITSIQSGLIVEQKSTVEEPHVKPLSRSTPVAKPKQPRKFVTCCVESLVRFTRNLAKKVQINIEIVGKRMNRYTYKMRSTGLELFRLVRHLEGRTKRVDCNPCKFADEIEEILTEHNKNQHRIYDISKLEHGDSGLVLHNKRLGLGDSGTFVVRGRYNDAIVDAKAEFEGHYAQLEQYSDTSRMRQFWDGMNSTFSKHKLYPTTHTCVRDLDVSVAGQATGHLLQSLLPCALVTCGTCFKELNNYTDQALKSTLFREDVLAEVNEGTDIRYKVLARNLALANKTEPVHGNACVSTEMAMLIGNAQTAPLLHMRDLLTYISKGNTITQDENDKALSSLLEIIRWYRNRTDTLKSSSTTVFRNKISSKNHINLALMSDKQLDDDGRFDWKSRGYHFKRFTDDYFTTIKAGSDYTQISERKHIRGSRQLATRNLIVHSDPDKMINSFQCIIEPDIPVTDACITRLAGQPLYPLCCVTMDDGTPATSRFYPPTKDHLVIGNTGDPKLVNTPKSDGPMLMVKDGYCYIHIFISMLTYVPEERAKDFTKLVRDYGIKVLGAWPTLQRLAATCAYIGQQYPAAYQAELPIMLVDHTHKTIHVVDSYGSASVRYHILKANTVAQLRQLVDAEITGELKDYNVGGDSTSWHDATNEELPDLEPFRIRWLDQASHPVIGAGDPIIPEQPEHTLFRHLVAASYKPKKFKALITCEPYLLLVALISPSALIRLHKDKSICIAIEALIRKGDSAANVIATLELLAKKVSIAKTFADQLATINAVATQLLGMVNEETRRTSTLITVSEMLTVLSVRFDMNEKLMTAGYIDTTKWLEEKKEQYFTEIQSEEYNKLSWWEKLSYHAHCIRSSAGKTKFVSPTRLKLTDETFGQYFERCTGAVSNQTGNIVTACTTRCRNILERVRLGTTRNLFNTLIRSLPNSFKFLTVASSLLLLVSIIENVQRVIIGYNAFRQQKLAQLAHTMEHRVQAAYFWFERTNPDGFTCEEFLEYLKEKDIEAHKWYTDEIVTHQSRDNERKLEQTVATIAMLMLIFDRDRGDATFRTLSKLKTFFQSFGTVHHQNDDIMNDIAKQKGLTIDFQLTQEPTIEPLHADITFERFWDAQLKNGRTLPHYRDVGIFKEFTRGNSAALANEIHLSPPGTEYIIRGAVGSGKSTQLPFSLSMKGSVLLLEPTRPLTENVANQLRGTPFNLNPTVRMRMLNSFGSSPISVMTTGFAFQYLAHNISYIDTYDFIIYDECHVMDASAMALYALLRNNNYRGKLLKVSATPPGRECEFTTQYPVTIATESHLTFEAFASAQGTGSQADVISKGCNILVYVASYSEVDQLSDKLTKRAYQVTKIDGRTLKVGSVNIKTHGTPGKPHFLVATNIIENGVTLDIDVVVDFGTKVKPSLDAGNRLVTYNKTNISYGERIQRLGRVGRIKEGYGLRIGSTERGLVQIPDLIATEAALMCFVHGLPVLTGNVVVSALAKCCARQARTMAQFELPYLYTQELVRYDGSMHPEIFNLLKPFRLNESEVEMNERAIPYGIEKRWLSVGEYASLGYIVNIENQNARVPYGVNGPSDKLHGDIYDVCCKYKDHYLGRRIDTACATQIAYTLKTDIHSLARTAAIINSLIEEEQTKAEAFTALSAQSLSSSTFNINKIVNMFRNRYQVNHSQQNLRILHEVKSQLQSYSQLGDDPFSEKVIQAFPYLTTIHHQNSDDMASHLKLQGRFDTRKIANDVIVGMATFIGGAILTYVWFKDETTKPVHHQGKKARLKFQNSRFNKELQCLHGDDDEIARNFGKAYRKKGKQTGHTRGMGTKTAKFCNFYGFDPVDYDYIRFLDPLTGITYDRETYMTDIDEVVASIETDREELVDADVVDLEKFRTEPRLKAYFVSKALQKALEIDMTKHDPLVVSRTTKNIAGYPERSGEFRQTGASKTIAIADVPTTVTLETRVRHEGKSIARGIRNYNPIAEMVCTVENTKGLTTRRMFGLCYGRYIIVNAHFFEWTGPLKFRTSHGTFSINDTTSLKVQQVEDRDIAVIQMPKDYPPMSQRLKFRSPRAKDKVVLVGCEFKPKRIEALISAESHIFHRQDSTFWSHKITTKDGQCGLPLVSIDDCSIVGIHSLGDRLGQENYMAAFTDDFFAKFLDQPDTNTWGSNWTYNPNTVSWGTLRLESTQPASIFNVTKRIESLNILSHQASDEQATWFSDSLCDNLQLVGLCPNNLVTKHVVRGRCPHFELYLSLHDEAEKYFRPRMGHYDKSRLNRQAFTKDIMKYAKPIPIGTVDIDAFEMAMDGVLGLFVKLGFEGRQYVTDSKTIVDSLNKKAAVGALYTGKKSEYFQDKTDDEIDEIVVASCERLYNGHMGLWNGSLKAELRPIEKVQENKTRVFTAAPLETLLGGKVCVDDFNNLFYDKHLEGPWTVGISKFFGGWDRLLNKLPDGWLYCDADGSQFDSSLTPFLINAVLNLRTQLMEDWNIGERMLRNLYTEIIYTPIATPDGSVIKKHKGNNSGQPSTVVDNTIMVVIAMYYSMAREGILDQSEKVVFFANGDDLLIAVPPELAQFYDTLQAHFATLGLNYNFDNRTTDRTKLSYMSHSGKLRDGIYIPKLDEERVVAILEWDRAEEPEHRLCAIISSMIEAWGHDELLHQIRKFYFWLLEQAPFSVLAQVGKAPYIAETALRNLYIDQLPQNSELQEYLDIDYALSETPVYVTHQSTDTTLAQGKEKDKDVDVGTTGTYNITPLKTKSMKMRLPKVKGKSAINLDHLLQYKPSQEEISNTIATQEQFDHWYERVMEDYGKTDDEMAVILGGLMVWCIENGTSPNLTGYWTMISGDGTQVAYPLQPLLEHAKPTFRQIMGHYSDAAEAYIQMRNKTEKYMPRYGRIRNLTDFNHARFAFDFHVITSRTPSTGVEVCHQMKAAALVGSRNRTFGLDGNISVTENDTERHTALDVNRGTHNLNGARIM